MLAIVTSRTLVSAEDATGIANTASAEPISSECATPAGGWRLRLDDPPGGGSGSSAETNLTAFLAGLRSTAAEVCAPPAEGRTEPLAAECAVVDSIGSSTGGSRTSLGGAPAGTDESPGLEPDGSSDAAILANSSGRLAAQPPPHATALAIKIARYRDRP